MSVQNSYNQWADTYDADQNLTRDLDEAATRVFLDTRQFSSVLEAGCGTGKNTNRLAEHSAQVLAIDFSNEMLVRARKKVQVDHVRFEQVDLNNAWPVEDAPVDLVMCNLVLEHIADLGFICAEARRVLLPGGQLRISELHPFRQYQGKKARFTNQGQMTEIESFVHHISDYLSAAETHQFGLKLVQEHWHELDLNKPPRLITFLFE